MYGMSEYHIWIKYIDEYIYKVLAVLLLYEYWFTLNENSTLGCW